jgi:hypothetical protein
MPDPYVYYGFIQIKNVILLSSGGDVILVDTAGFNPDRMVL